MNVEWRVVTKVYRNDVEGVSRGMNKVKGLERGVEDVEITG